VEGSLEEVVGSTPRHRDLGNIPQDMEVEGSLEEVVGSIRNQEAVVTIQDQVEIALLLKPTVALLLQAVRHLRLGLHIPMNLQTLSDEQYCRSNISSKVSKTIKCLDYPLATRALIFITNDLCLHLILITVCLKTWVIFHSQILSMLNMLIYH
jgi:hypothetical protein